MILLRCRIIACKNIVIKSRRQIIFGSSWFKLRKINNTPKSVCQAVVIYWHNGLNRPLIPRGTVMV